MMRFIKLTFFNLKDALFTAGPFVGLAVFLLGLAYYLIDPTPPHQLVLTAGQENSAYENFAKRYQTILAQHHIELRLQRSSGSLDNLRNLSEVNNAVAIGFVQSGFSANQALFSSSQSAQNFLNTQNFSSPQPDHALADLVSIGSLFYEPLWLFYREDSAKRMMPNSTLDSLNQLKSWRVNIDHEGSGVPNIVKQLLDANQLNLADITSSTLEETPAVAALLEGKLDALFLASAPDSSLVQLLLQAPGIKLFNFAQAEAYARRFPYLSHVVLPRGIVDLGRDIPAQDVHLVAPTATLIAKADTHPALMQLLVQAAAEIHSGPGWFRKPGEFPNAKYSELPIAKEASKFYQHGTPLLQRYLPFWLSNMVERMWVAMISIFALLLPLSRIVPPLYEWKVRSRIFKWYGQLRAIEKALAEQSSSKADLQSRLDEVEQNVHQITVPLSYADELYALRSHIDWVRNKLLSAA